MRDEYDAVLPILHCDQGFKAWTAIPITRRTNPMTTATSTKIARRRHVVMALALVERMSDALLVECFKSDEGGFTAKDARAYIAELREKGYSYFPCSCPVPNADGSCPGVKPDDEQQPAS